MLSIFSEYEKNLRVFRSSWVNRRYCTPRLQKLFKLRMEEAIETSGWCPQEGKGKGGAKRVHVDATYEPLRKLLGEEQFR